MTITRDLPVWRSLMYVPINVDKFVTKAHTRGADVIQLDLEDSVPPSEKAAARQLVERVTPQVRAGGGDVVVRINRPIQLAVRDIEHSVVEGVDGLAITKVDSASHLKILDELVSELELARGLPVGGIRFIAMIETAEAFLDIGNILCATDRIVAANIGGEDFATDCNMEPLAETLLYPKQHMVIAANAAGVMPLGFVSSVADYSDMDAFAAMVRRSRAFGFMGAGCIHPLQVPVINEAYKPGDDEVKWAQKVIDGYEVAKAEGRASFALDNKMIDIPIVERAERLVRRAEEVAAREATKAAAHG